MDGARITLITAADANYFDYLTGLIDSVLAAPVARSYALSILDVGLDAEQVTVLRDRGLAVAKAGWDVEFPGRDSMPEYYKAMTARPYLPRYFPGHDVYLWLDSDAWVQDDSVFPYFVRGALRGQVACVPELDRGYWTQYRRPKLWTQNHKAFAWAYGLRAGDRWGRNPIVGVGIFALSADAPHWAAWADAHRRALTRRRRKPPGLGNFYAFLSEQTAFNYMIFADKLPATFLPAYTHWVCGKGDLLFDEASGRLVEPHEPHQPIGVVHPGGQAMKERTWAIKTVGGRTIHAGLTYSAFQAFLSERAGSLIEPAAASAGG